VRKNLRKNNKTNKIKKSCFVYIHFYTITKKLKQSQSSSSSSSISDAEIQSRIVYLEHREKHLSTQLSRLNRVIRENHETDLICDWISQVYHVNLVKFMQSIGFKCTNWSDISTAISEKQRHFGRLVKDICAEFCGITINEWDSIHVFKRKRNIRCHQRAKVDEVREILRNITPDAEIVALRKLCDAISVK